jgi:hypothetical protein
MRWNRALPVALLAVVAPRSQGTVAGAFIVRLGSDTIFVEQYARTADRLEGDQISRVAVRTTLRHFVATLDAQGSITRYDVTGRPASEGASPLQQASMTFTADTATVQLTVGDSSRTVRVAAPAGTIPYVNSSYALIELLTQRARAQAGGEPVLFQVLPIGAPSPSVASVQRLTADTVLIMFGDGNPVKVRVDGTGLVLGATGLGSADQVTVERVTSVDIPALTRSFARRPFTRK